MGEEIGRFEGSYKVTAGLWKKWGGKRVRDTPIAEEGFVGAGIGAAMLGLRPVVEIMTINFILVAMDKVVNHAAKISQMFGGKVGVPMVIRTPGGAGAQLTAQHSQSLEVMFAHMPGLKVVAPSTPADAYGLLKTAIRDDDPVMFHREPRALQPDRPGARRRRATTCWCRSAAPRSCARAATSRSSPTRTPSAAA